MSLLWINALVTIEHFATYSLFVFFNATFSLAACVLRNTLKQNITQYIVH